MTRRVLAAGVVLTALVPFVLPSATRAGDKGDLDVKGEMKVGNHALKAEAGTFYVVRVQGKGFYPIVGIEPGFFTFPPLGLSPALEKNTALRYFFPKETREYRLYVTPPASRLPEGPLEYTLQVKRIRFSKKPLLEEEGTLTAKDPGFGKGRPHKAYPVKLEASRFYVIDMVRKGKGKGSKGVSPVLFLRDPAGKTVVREGGLSSARLIFRPQTSGMYRVIAATQGDLGEFTLTVRSQVKEKSE
jgi:hypothetical protein